MEKLILERDESDFYKLEVNDKGEYIEFDLTDIGFPERMVKAVDKIRAIDKEYTDSVNKLADDKDIDLETKARSILQAEQKYFDEMNKTFDSFLGEGACKKIFGDKKVYGQYNKLLDGLQPHFNKMSVNMKKAKQRLADRYLNKDSDTL